MGLSNFSAVLSFAIQSEKDALEAFDQILKSTTTANHECFAKLRTESEKALKTLQTILRENVTELVMEPFEELNEEKYRLSSTESQPLEKARAILSGQRQFFQDAAGVVNLREVKRALTRLAEKKTALLSEIPML